MAETPYSSFRLGLRTLADLDALAAPLGTRSRGVREAIHYWRRLVEDAGQQNASELSEPDWTRLAQLSHPDTLTPDLATGEEERTTAYDWSQLLAHNLVGMWEGRNLTLPAYQEEARACRALAKRIQGWGMVRGYALMLALRHFWSQQDTPPGWWEPAVWLAPRQKGE